MEIIARPSTRRERRKSRNGDTFILSADYDMLPDGGLDAEHEIVPVVIVGLPTAFYMAKKVVAVVLWLILIYGALAVITGIVLVSCTRILDSVV